MSVVENVANHADELESEVANMNELMGKCPTGMQMLQTSQSMATSEEMMGLMETIGNPEIPEKERMQLAEYMGEMLKRDPENGLVQYAEYLEGVVKDPKYAKRIEYYGKIAELSRSVNATDTYKEYIKAYNAFEADQSAEAKAARDATAKMQEKMKQWANG